MHSFAAMRVVHPATPPKQNRTIGVRSYAPPVQLRRRGARTDTELSVRLGRGGFWDEVIIAHTLEHQEARRIRARVRDPMRASGAGGSPILTDAQLDALVREAQRDPDPATQNVEGVLDI